MSRGKHFDFRVARIQKDDGKRDEAIVGEIACKQAVETFENLVLIRKEAGTRIRATQCAHECWTDSVSGRIADADRELTVG